MNNIPGLNEDESKWVWMFTLTSAKGEKFDTPPPSHAALDFVLESLKTTEE